MKTRNRVFGLLVRLLVVCACLLGIRESWKIYRSDELYSENTAESVRAAIRLEPDCWWCYMQLARLDEGNAEGLLRTSLQLNQYNSEAAMDLGLRYEADGNFRGAEDLLFQAFAVDKTYPPRWTLANFYFRRDNFPAFWTWARRAAEMPTDEVGALFELCWRVAPDPSTIEAKILDNDPDLLRQYIDFLVRKDRASGAAGPALQLARTDSIHWDWDRERLLRLVDRLVAAGDAAGASAVWRELILRHWIVADLSFPNNAKFERDPLPVSFDWYLAAYGGLHSWPGSSGLETEFTGDEPEDCPIAEQMIALPPGAYRVDSFYHTRNIAPNTGIVWEIADPKSDKVLASSAFLASDSPAHLSLLFSVTPDSSLLRLRLAYHRQPGTTRVAGTLAIPSVSIQPATR